MVGTNRPKVTAGCVAVQIAEIASLLGVERRS
jgi:hypothetical protein